MTEALRIQALTLPVREIEPVDKFCRWALQLKAAPDYASEHVRRLAWGREDRIELVDAGAVPEAREGVTLRMPAKPLAGVAAWLEGRNFEPARVVTPPEDADEAAERWPESPRDTFADEARWNGTVVTVRGPAEPRLDLFFPLPREALTSRDRVGPFYWSSRDRGDLEVPGLLGVTIGTPDPEAYRRFLAAYGIEPPEDDPEGPLAVGDHQWIVERREPAGIYGYAVVVPAEKLKDLARTMEHLEIDHRLEGARVLAADPAGRIVLIHGVRAG